jgi:hypothetical protein
VEPVEIEILRTCAFKKKGTETVTTNKRDGTVETREVKRQGCARCGKPKQDESHIGAPSLAGASAGAARGVGASEAARAGAR